ncbi:RNA polymerase sigma factor [Paenibacillus humicus]|uniref:RNA polymerase sigma factor n=1 Tax=Paenibacillus humicus TaxID=412861 RepID=UPI003D2CE21F
MSSRYTTMQPIRTLEQMKSVKETELLQEPKQLEIMRPAKGTVIVHPYKPSPETKIVPQAKHLKQPMPKLHQEARSMQPSKALQQSNIRRQSRQLKPSQQSKQQQRLNPHHQQSKQHQQPNLNLVGADQRSTASLQLETRHDSFLEWVQSYQRALSQYCRSLVGTSWEAEDLVQETWLKVWRISLEKGSDFSVNKSYLYKIANHIYIDGRRKNRTSAELYSMDQTTADELQADEADVASLWTAMETIVNRLPINQRITLMLIDVFRYTAAEAAELLSTTEGAVKALLHRARTKLRSERENTGTDKGSWLGKRSGSAHATPHNEQIVYAYLKAFREHNPRALLLLMNESTALEQLQPPVLQKHRQENARHQDDLKAAAYRQMYVWAAA